MVIGGGPGVALLYHDVVANDSADESGIVTDGSWRYKLPPDRFRDHLQRIAASPYEVVTLPDLNADRPLLLTFDDGGVSCVEAAAPLLEAHGMRGHFFIITDRIGQDGYLTRKQVRDLAEAGHRIGSHTVTHANLRELDAPARKHELRESKRTIEDLLDTDCVSVSIPGGFADERVITEALEAGYEYVFVSEPRYLPPNASTDSIGRWNIWQDTTAEKLGRILDRSLLTRLRIQSRWYTLKTVKRAIGQERFEWLRQPFVSRR
jgi:peptidoglycan/xylan/chitin deacetylase (PgdA/CDA1 family)